MIRIVYRSTWKDGRKPRPEYFSKSLALMSMLRAAELHDDAEIHFINDGDMPEDRLAVMRRFGVHVHNTGGAGNSGSYRLAIEYVLERGWPESDLVLFQEDDYFLMPDAVVELAAAAQRHPDIQYLTLYDHPDRYSRSDDAGLARTRVIWSGTRHWRVVESSCMSFAIRVGQLRRDRWIHRLFTVGTYPRDRWIWYLSQGIGLFFWKFPKGRMISPLPSLSSHMESGQLAHGIDWENVGRDVRVWMSDKGLHETA
jgi:hypothetical protein